MGCMCFDAKRVMQRNCVTAEVHCDADKEWRFEYCPVDPGGMCMPALTSAVGAYERPLRLSGGWISYKADWRLPQVD